MPQVAFTVDEKHDDTAMTMPPSSSLTPPPAGDLGGDGGLRLTQRSDGSAGSGGGGGGNSIGGHFPKSPRLRGNLTRQHRDRDPMEYYDIVQVLGAGSIGSVTKVRKKLSTVGGSARYDTQERRRVLSQMEACFSLPIVGGLFSHCLRGKADALLERPRLRTTSEGSKISALTSEGTEASSLSLDVSSSSQVSSSELIFALKSIHLKHITDKTLLEELKNEVLICTVAVNLFALARVVCDVRSESHPFHCEKNISLFPTLYRVFDSQ